MSLLSSRSKDEARVAPTIGWMFFLALLISPAYAHNVKTSEDVAVTFHIEPNHNPKAGEKAQAWFALTRKGGRFIPLEECDCKLAVYSEPHKEGSAPLLQPPLKAISAEQYQGIPGADIVFPKPGAYELELSGAPKNEEHFKPFELSYEVTVAAGTPQPIATSSTLKNQSQQSVATEERSPSTGSLPIVAIAIATIVGLGVLGFVWRRLK